MNWYSEITKDISRIPDAMIFYETEYSDSKRECKIKGVVEKLSAEMPGIVEHRFSQLQEIEAILEYLNIELRKIKSDKFRFYLEKYNRSLSSKDCEKFSEGELEVIEFYKIINEFALLRNKWLGITKALEQKSYALSNIIKLKCAGIDDAEI